MRNFLFTGLCGWFLLTSVSAPAAGVPPRDRLLILISLDGFRWDYREKFAALTPHLNELAAAGVTAQRLIPAFPSLTFPNHYTLATGLWPAHHGIVNNRIYDPAMQQEFYITGNPGPTEGKWWGGEPIWVTAVKQGRVADCMFWPGSEAAIEGVRPTHWKPFDSKLSPTQCVDAGLQWLTEPGPRPSLLTLYFHQVDSASHHQGIDSPQFREAVSAVDAALGHLMDRLKQLHLEDAADLVIVSDHGMTEVSTNRLILLSDYVDLSTVRVDATGAIAGLRPQSGTVGELFQKFAAHENHFKTYRAENMPERYHYTGNPRIPPVVLVADEGWYISKKPLDPTKRFEYATHGFDPMLPSMGATFIATGPAFRHGITLPPTPNVDVYNLLCATMGLQAATNDGHETLAKEVLAP